MKPASPELRALLATGQFFSADLYTFWNGGLGSTILRYTAGDDAIVSNGLSFGAGGQIGPYFDRRDNKAKCHWKVGLEVDTLSFSVIPGVSAILNGLSWQAAVKYGVFDGAYMMLERAYMPVYGDTTVGTLRYFVGRVAEVDSGRANIVFNVASHLELLNLQLPRNLFQSGCKNILGDAACTVNKENFKTTGVVGVGASTSVIPCSLAGGPWTGAEFGMGKIVFTSGTDTQLQATVQSVRVGPNVINLLGFLPQPPATGDTFNLYFGCDKTLGPQGCPKFNNTPFFRAERLVPLPVTVA